MDKSTNTVNCVNGLDLGALQEIVQAIGLDPGKAQADFCVKTKWLGQTRSEASVDTLVLGGETIPRGYKICIDEPLQLLGQNTAPNPQEMLMAAFNACITVGYVAGAAVSGITLEKLEIETRGSLDLRGFLGLDDKIKPGYDKIQYTVRMKGNGTLEQYREIHEKVMKTSPNYFNLSQPVRIESTLEVM